MSTRRHRRIPLARPTLRAGARQIWQPVEVRPGNRLAVIGLAPQCLGPLTFHVALVRTLVLAAARERGEAKAERHDQGNPDGKDAPPPSPRLGDRRALPRTHD